MTPADLRARLATNIRRICKRRRWSLNRLADLAGVSRNAVHLVALGRTACTIDTIAKLADALDVEPEALIGPARR